MSTRLKPIPIFLSHLLRKFISRRCEIKSKTVPSLPLLLYLFRQVLIAETQTTQTAFTLVASTRWWMLPKTNVVIMIAILLVSTCRSKL